MRADQTGRLWWGALGGAALGVALLAGAPQFAMYNAFAVSGLALVLVGRRVGAGQPWGRLSLACLLVPVVALGVAAVQLFPAWAVATGSYRAGLGFEWKAQGSLPLERGVPARAPRRHPAVDHVAQRRDLLLSGILPVILAGYVLTLRWDWRVGFHAALGLGALLLAFGDRFVLYRLAFDLVPGVALFRIPARILVLFNFAVGHPGGPRRPRSAQEPRGDRAPPRCSPGSRRSPPRSPRRCICCLLWSANGVLADAATTLADQYVLLLLVLFLIFAAVAWQARGDAPGLVRAALLVALVLDLVLGSLPINGTRSHPDRESERERELAAFLDAQPGPFRVTLAARLGPRTIYRYAISVVDGGSTFAPSRFLDLYFLAEENPRILDLLNVRYLARSRRQPLPEPVQSLVLPPGAFHRVTLPGPRITRTLEVDSRLIGRARRPRRDRGGPHPRHRYRRHLAHVPDPGRPRDRRVDDRPARCGRGPPEASRRALVADARRGVMKGTATGPPSDSLRAFVWPSWPSSGRRPSGWLQIEEIRLDGEALRRRAPYRLIRPELYENDAVLPRAFLVRRARRVAPERLLEELKHFDPAEEALLTDPLPPGWPTQAPLGRPLPPVRVAEYTPHRVRLETTVTEPVLLILSDTHDRGWQAWDNGRPVSILRTDHALRGVPLGPGSHVVEFRYRQPAFWLGLGVSGVTVLGLAIGGVLAWRRRARAARR